MRKHFVHLLLALSFILPLQAQESDDPVLLRKEALELFDQGRIQLSIEKFRYISDRFAGTEHSLEALYFLAENPTTKEEGQAAYQQIMLDFSETVHVTYAKIGLLNLNFSLGDQDRQAFIRNCEDILEDLGGPSLESILDSQTSKLAAEEIAAADNQKQRELLAVYRAIYGKTIWSFSSAGGVPGGGSTSDQQRALKLLRFLREAFEPLGIYEGMSSILYALGPDGPRPGTQREFADPTISFLAPSPGSTTGPQPRIQAQITIGDLLKYQLSIANLEARLDGIDVKSQVRFDLEYGEIQPGEIYETVLLEFVPINPLAPGQHSFSLVAPVNKYSGEGPGQTTATLNFFVQTTGGEVSLVTKADSTLTQRHPHQNEGANPRLHLKKVTGKPAQVVVGFDTSNIDKNGLTKASLVLNIDSTQNVTGWGNGRPIRAQRLLTAWAEGNGKTLDIPNNQKSAGSGSGATWFSPVDSNISNDQADSAVNWNGAATYAAPSTAPTAIIKNHQSGEVTFDVTQDLLNGAEHGWLITRDQDVGSQVAFLSKEGAGSDLAPKLILEYGASTANLNAGSTGLLAYLGLSRAPNLTRLPSGSELRTARDILQGLSTKTDSHCGLLALKRRLLVFGPRFGGHALSIGFELGGKFRIRQG